MAKTHKIVITCENGCKDARFISNASTLVVALKDARSAGWLCENMRHGGNKYKTVLEFCPECRKKIEALDKYKANNQLKQ